MRTWMMVLAVGLACVDPMFASEQLESFKKAVELEKQRAISLMDQYIEGNKASIAVSNSAGEIHTLSTCKADLYAKGFLTRTQGLFEKLSTQDAKEGATLRTTAVRELEKRAQAGCIALDQASIARRAQLAIPVKLNGALTKVIDHGADVELEVVTQINSPLWVGDLVIRLGGANPQQLKADVLQGSAPEGSKHKQRWKGKFAKPKRGTYDLEAFIHFPRGRVVTATRSHFQIQL